MLLKYKLLDNLTPFAFFIFLVAAVVLLARPVLADPPTLPQAWVDTTYNQPTANTITVCDPTQSPSPACNSNDDPSLQHALNTAASLSSALIIVRKGQTFIGPITLPKRS